MTTDQAVKIAAASLEMEGYHIDSDCIQLCKKLLNNEINMDEYIVIVKQKAESLKCRV